MKNKLEVIEWLMEQRYDENNELLKSIYVVMEEKEQSLFSDDDMLGMYLCGTYYCGTDWRKALADYKEMMEQLNTNK